MPALASGTGLSPSLAGFPKAIPLPPPVTYAVRTPAYKICWFGLFPFRSPLLWESIFLSLPPGTKMFQFPGLSSLPYFIQIMMTGYDSSQVAPFGYPRIDARLQLPEAFRS